MPICSMTGYGQTDVQDQDWTVCVRLRSLNHRYLEVRVSGLDQHPALELKLRERVQGAFDRGRVDVEVELRRARQVPALRFDLELARRYLEDLSQLSRALGLAEPPSLELLLGMDGVTQREALEDEALRPLLARALEGAIAEAQRMRAAEGERLEAELRDFLRQLRALSQEIAARAPALKDAMRQRLLERIAALEGTVTLDEARLEEEVILFAERSDISEELSRLSSHFEAVERALGDHKPAGKVLDFLAQEIGREVNTIGAKAKDAAISHAVIEMKAVLEKFREQVRNLE